MNIHGWITIQKKIRSENWGQYHTIPQVTRFKCLEPIIQDDGEIEEE